MGLSIYAFASKKKPSAETNCRKPWKYIEDGPHEGLMEDTGIDKEIWEWDRNWDLHCWIHNLFIEKDGVYDDKNNPFNYPDCVELNDDDLDRLKSVFLNLSLPACDSYLDIKPEGISLCDVWPMLTTKAKIEMAKRFKSQLSWLEENLKFIEKAEELIGEGQYVYVFSSW